MSPRRLAALAAALLALAAPARGVQSDPVDRAEVLVASGRYDEARAILDEILAGGGELAGARRARALMLRASLQTDAAAAEVDYLEVVLGYPTSSDAAEALLRLGQGALMGGDALRAVGYLQRLVRDYPGSQHRATALLWLARAHDVRGEYAARCAALANAIQSARGDAVLVPLILAANTEPRCIGLPEPAAPPASAGPSR